MSVTEPLGNETLVFVEFAGRDWVSRMLNPRALGAGDMISVSFDLAKARSWLPSTAPPSGSTAKTIRSLSSVDAALPISGIPHSAR